MADILDAAQSNTPASPAGGQPPPSGAPTEAPPPPTSGPPESPVTPPEPTIPPPPPAISTDSLIIPPPEIPPLEPPIASPTPPPASELPPEKPKKKSRLGVLIAGLLLLAITIPILTVFVRQQVEIRSRAATYTGCIGTPPPNCYVSGFLIKTCVGREESNCIAVKACGCSATYSGGTTPTPPPGYTCPYSCNFSSTECHNYGTPVSGYTCPTGKVCCNLGSANPTATPTSAPPPVCPYSCAFNSTECHNFGTPANNYSCSNGNVCCILTATPTPIPACPYSCDFNSTECHNFGTPANNYACTDSSKICCNLAPCPYSCNFNSTECHNFGTPANQYSCPTGKICCILANTPTPTPPLCPYSCDFNSTECHNFGTPANNYQCTNGNICCNLGLPTCPNTDCMIPSTVPGAIHCNLPTGGNPTYCCPVDKPLYQSGQCIVSPGTPTPTGTSHTPYCIFDNYVTECVGTDMCDVPVGEMGWLDSSCHQGGANTPSCALPYYCTSNGTCIKNGTCTPSGMANKNCHADASCGGGGGNTPTPTPPPQCINIIAYKDGNALSPAELAALHPGDLITLAFAPGGAATKVQFRVNAGTWNETSNKNTNGQFIWNYTLENVTSFTIEAQWFDGSVWN